MDETINSSETKKLKKVENFKVFQDKVNYLTQQMNNAYAESDSLKIDESCKALNSYLEDKIEEKHPLFVNIKNQTWQHNHFKIISSISTLMLKLNRMPSTNEISQQAGLSGETVYKHLKELKNHELFEHERDKFRLMEMSILTSLFNLGIQGDVRACKVYLDSIKTESNTQAQNSVNNYIQINGMIINQESIEQLNQQQLESIEVIFKSAATKVIFS